MSMRSKEVNGSLFQNLSDKIFKKNLCPVLLYVKNYFGLDQTLMSATQTFWTQVKFSLKSCFWSCNFFWTISNYLGPNSFGSIEGQGTRL